MVPLPRYGFGILLSLCALVFAEQFITPNMSLATADTDIPEVSATSAWTEWPSENPTQDDDEAPRRRHLPPPPRRHDERRGDMSACVCPLSTEGGACPGSALYARPDAEQAVLLSPFRPRRSYATGAQRPGVTPSDGRRGGCWAPLVRWGMSVLGVNNRDGTIE